MSKSDYYKFIAIDRVQIKSVFMSNLNTLHLNTQKKRN